MRPARRLSKRSILLQAVTMPRSDLDGIVIIGSNAGELAV